MLFARCSRSLALGLLAVAAYAVALSVTAAPAVAASCFGPRPSSGYVCVCFRTTDVSGRTVRKCYWQRR